MCFAGFWVTADFPKISDQFLGYCYIKGMVHPKIKIQLLRTLMPMEGQVNLFSQQNTEFHRKKGVAVIS